MTDAVIFDMDGLLIDSEPLWRRAEIEIFAEFGVSLTDAMCASTKGLRIDEVVAHWHRRFQWTSPTPAVVREKVVARVIELIAAEGQPLPGVRHAVDLAGAEGRRLALASSSSMAIIDAALTRLNIRERFAAVISAEHETYGKPHPAVFLKAAEALDVEPTACLVLEDSLPGVIAAKAARMRCIVVPENAERDEPRFIIADAMLNALSEFEAAHLVDSGMPM